MTTTIQSVHFNADKKLITFINDKVSKLATLHENIISCDVTLKLNKSEDNMNKLAEIKLILKGNELFTKKQCLTFEEAIDTSIDALKSQLIKYKEKNELS